ncbi:hypothetical protein D3C76_1664220 [compost metagenome]
MGLEPFPLRFGGLQHTFETIMPRVIQARDEDDIELFFGERHSGIERKPIARGYGPAFV